MTTLKHKIREDLKKTFNGKKLINKKMKETTMLMKAAGLPEVSIFIKSNTVYYWVEGGSV